MDVDSQYSDTGDAMLNDIKYTHQAIVGTQQQTKKNAVSCCSMSMLQSSEEQHSIASMLMLQSSMDAMLPRPNSRHAAAKRGEAHHKCILHVNCPVAP